MDRGGLEKCQSVRFCVYTLLDLGVQFWPVHGLWWVRKVSKALGFVCTRCYTFSIYNSYQCMDLNGSVSWRCPSTCLPVDAVLQSEGLHALHSACGGKMTALDPKWDQRLPVISVAENREKCIVFVKTTLKEGAELVRVFVQIKKRSYFNPLCFDLVRGKAALGSKGKPIIMVTLHPPPIAEIFPN